MNVVYTNIRRAAGSSPSAAWSRVRNRGRFSDRVLWGTDWPHPNLKSHMPDDGALVDFVPRIAITATLQRQRLADNPIRLYSRR